MIAQNQIQSSQSEHSSKEVFSPHSITTLEIKQDSAYSMGNSILYSQRHNMIMICPSDGTVQFYDASSLLPHKSRETLKLGYRLSAIDFWDETDVYLMGCIAGNIFAYDASSHLLKRLRNAKNMEMLAIAFLNSQYYAFSFFGSSLIHVASLEQKDLWSWSSKNSGSVSLKNFAKRNILLSGLKNGSVIVYRTDRLPKLTILHSTKSKQVQRKSGIKIESARICQREHIITYESDGEIRIWILIRGRMKLVRRITIGEIIHNLVYLEAYKLLAITYGTYPGLKFISLISGKCQSTLHLGMEVQKMFMMEDKNLLGVVEKQKNRMQLVSLGSPDF